mmetsp:Transcript_12788/g.37528  ORF Transcript_12788/g.37528 Transcript_12788/m.37528 type:complete len:233 (-) Transcript_12788:29-727(-)
MPRRNEPPEVQLSKKLSRVLRHRIQENGLTPVLRPDGFVPLDALLALPAFLGTSAEQVEAIVSADGKQRFALRSDDGRRYIRANQGHTVSGIEDDLIFTPLIVHEGETLMAVHGTYRNALGGIAAAGGLSRMSRNHIHLARGIPGHNGVISGMRASAQVHIWVNVGAAVASGVPFYLSANDVILTPGHPGTDGILPAHFIDRVVDARTGKDIPGIVRTMEAHSSPPEANAPG